MKFLKFLEIISWYRTLVLCAIYAVHSVLIGSCRRKTVCTAVMLTACYQLGIIYFLLRSVSCQWTNWMSFVTTSLGSWQHLCCCCRRQDAGHIVGATVVYRRHDREQVESNSGECDIHLHPPVCMCQQYSLRMGWTGWTEARQDMTVCQSQSVQYPVFLLNL